MCTNKQKIGIRNEEQILLDYLNKFDHIILPDNFLKFKQIENDFEPLNSYFETFYVSYITLYTNKHNSTSIVFNCIYGLNNYVQKFIFCNNQDFLSEKKVTKLIKFINTKIKNNETL